MSDPWAARLAGLAAAIEAAGDDVLAAPDGQEAYRRATELLEMLSGRRGWAARLRAVAVARWMRADRLSLGELARRMGMSKTRADQLAREGRRRDGG